MPLIFYAHMIYTGAISPLCFTENFMPQKLAFITELIVVR
jgi:hypothetical protein